ncbi:MAG: phosphatase PAP2 family protein [Parvibaculum sp.]|nr:phosphatase PAP2 family protein [Parvibaculum sp.]
MSLIRFFELLTKFGDQSFILPFALAVAAALWMGEARREARTWLLAIGMTLGVVLLLKLVFVPCGHLLPGWGLRSPSGHAAAGFAAFGGYAVLEAKLNRPAWQKWAILSAGFAFAALIAFSRLIVHAHSAPEVVLGSLVGLIAPAILLWQIKPQTKPAIANPLALAPLLPLALLLLFNGRALPIEQHITAFAVAMTRAWGFCI